MCLLKDISKMHLSLDITEWKSTQSYFAKSKGEITLESILILQFRLLKCFKSFKFK